VFRAQSLPYTIGKLAALTQVSADTLRYYERERLLQPRGKSESGYRLYDEEAARRVKFIRHAQECGFTLAEIRELLTLRGRDSACCEDVRRVAVERKLQLESKIRSMRAMSTSLDRLIAACNRDGMPVDACPILIGLEQTELRK
jgi:MerR family Zn(II)-responsive transcriptional regulator of zntA